MFNWLKKIKQAIFKKSPPGKSDETHSTEADAFLKKLTEVFPLQNKCYGKLEFVIGRYIFVGGWLSDSFYFDVYDGRKEFKIYKEGRIYIAKGHKSDGIKYTSHKCGERNDVISSTIFESLQGFDKRDLAKAVNFIIPNLIK